MPKVSTQRLAQEMGGHGYAPYHHHQQPLVSLSQYIHTLFLHLTTTIRSSSPHNLPPTFITKSIPRAYNITKCPTPTSQFMGTSLPKRHAQKTRPLGISKAT